MSGTSGSRRKNPILTLLRNRIIYVRPKGGCVGVTVFTQTLIVYIERIYFVGYRRKFSAMRCRVCFVRKYVLSRKITSINTDVFR